MLYKSSHVKVIKSMFYMYGCSWNATKPGIYLIAYTQELWKFEELLITGKHVLKENHTYLTLTNWLICNISAYTFLQLTAELVLL